MVGERHRYASARARIRLRKSPDTPRKELGHAAAREAPTPFPSRQRSCSIPRIAGISWTHAPRPPRAREWGSKMDGLIELLFKYRPVVFERGHVVFGASGTARIAAIALGLAAIVAVASYTRVRARGTKRDRIILGAMRATILALLVLALLHPALLISTTVPQRNVVGVLVDDSRSMQVPDMDGRTRADVVRSLLNA